MQSFSDNRQDRLKPRAFDATRWRDHGETAMRGHLIPSIDCSLQGWSEQLATLARARATRKDVVPNTGLCLADG